MAGYLDNITIQDLAVSIRQIINLLGRPLWVNPSTGKLYIDSGTITTVSTVSTVTTVTTVSTVTACTTLGTLQKVGVVAPTDWYFAQQVPMEREAWHSNVRANIT